MSGMNAGRNANYNIRERMQNRFEVDQRAALFGGRGAAGGRSRSDDHGGGQTRDLLERQNDAQIADLEGKVSQLIGLTSSMGKEIRSSNALLDGLGIDFDKAGSLLKGTMSQLKVMMNNKGSRHLCVMMGFVLILFFTMYLLRKLSFLTGWSSRGTPQLEVEMNSSGW